MRKEINKRKKISLMVMISAIVIAITGYIYGADHKITARKEMTPSSGHTTQYFEVTGGYKGVCSDPRDSKIGTVGMKVSMSRQGNSSLVAKIAYRAWSDKYAVGTSKKDSYVVSRAIARARIFGFNSYGYRGEVDELYNDAKNDNKVPDEFEVYVGKPSNGGQELVVWKQTAPKIGDFRIIKKGKAFPAIFQNPPTVEGAEYTIWDSSWNKVKTLKIKKRQDGGKTIYATYPIGLPVGKYHVTETAIPRGYKKAPDQTFEIKDKKFTEIESIESTDVRYAAFKFRKDLETSNGRTAPEANALFEIYPKKYGSYANTPGEFRDKVYTNGSGITSSTKSLPAIQYDFDGVYVVNQIGGSNYHQALRDFQITLDRWNADGLMVVNLGVDKPQTRKLEIKKLDKETGEVVKEAGIQFKIYDRITKEYVVRGGKDVFETNNDGIIRFNDFPAGLYRLEEIKAPKEYNLAPPKDFEVKGSGGTEVTVTCEDPHIPPEVKTTALDSETDDHISDCAETVKIIDTVSYDHLYVGKKYTIKGKLIDKETGKPLLVNGSEVTTSTTFVTTSPKGTVNLEYVLNASALKGKTVVVFEDLYKEDKKVASHADINDEGQSVHFPKVSTKALDEKTQEHMSSSGNKIVLVDTVKYENVLSGKEYTVSGLLMDKETGKPMLDKNRKEIKGESTFTAVGSSGEVKVKYIVDTEKLKGRRSVVFEKLFYKGKQVAKHEDIKDDGQTVIFPEIKTKAIDKETDDHVGSLDEKIEIVDTVSYKNLIKDKEYTISGILMDKDTGKPMLDESGKEIKAFKKFTAKESSGSIDISFFVNSKLLKGKTVVVFEDLKYKDIKVGIHADIKDEGQSVYFPKIRTAASDLHSKDQLSLAKPKTTIIDTVSFENLIKGKEYTVSGKIMDKETGKPILSLDGKEITGGTKFSPKAGKGDIRIIYTLDTVMLKGKDIVVFEEMYFKNKLIAEHKDIADEGQTVHIPALKTKALEKGTNENIIRPKKVNVVRDTAWYKNLMPNKKYVARAMLVDKKTSRRLVETQAVKEFTPSTKDGEFTIDLKLDGIKYAGKKLVVFEYVSLKKDKQVTVAEHTDITSKQQTVEIENVGRLEINDTNKFGGVFTGDNSRLLFYIAIFLIAAGTYVVAVKKKNKGGRL